MSELEEKVVDVSLSLESHRAGPMPMLSALFHCEKILEIMNFKDLV